MSEFAKHTIEEETNLGGEATSSAAVSLKTTPAKSGIRNRLWGMFFGSSGGQQVSGNAVPESPDASSSPKGDDERARMHSSSFSESLVSVESSTKSRTSSIHFIPELRGTDSLTFSSVILTVPHALALFTHLPDSLRMQHFSLVYSMLNDGSDLTSFYNKVKARQSKGSSSEKSGGCMYTVLIIQTVQGAEFGCFSASLWKNQGAFYGSGQSFLFKFRRNSIAEEGAGNTGNTGLPNHENTAVGIDVFKWTGMNTLFQYGSDEKIAMGGGGKAGGFGFVLDKDFYACESTACDTYGNPGSLDERSESSEGGKGAGTGAGGSTVANVELWTFQL